MTFFFPHLVVAESGFAVTAISRTPGVTYFDSFDLQCILKPHYPSWVGISVTWRFQPVGGGESHELVTFSHSGGVQWGERSGNFRGRSVVEKSDSSHNVRLSISRASDSEAGKYQCVAELWRREYNASWVRLAERASNLLEIRVQRPGEQIVPDLSTVLWWHLTMVQGICRIFLGIIQWCRSSTPHYVAVNHGQVTFDVASFLGSDQLACLL